MEALSKLLRPGFTVLDYKGGEGAHWGLRVLYRVRKLHLRAPLFRGHLAAHISSRALVEVADMRVLLEVPSYVSA